MGQLQHITALKATGKSIQGVRNAGLPLPGSARIGAGAPPQRTLPSQRSSSGLSRRCTRVVEVRSPSLPQIAALWLQSPTARLSIDHQLAHAAHRSTLRTLVHLTWSPLAHRPPLPPNWATDPEALVSIIEQTYMRCLCVADGGSRCPGHLTAYRVPRPHPYPPVSAFSSDRPDSSGRLSVLSRISLGSC